MGCRILWTLDHSTLSHVPFPVPVVFTPKFKTSAGITTQKA